VGVLPAVAMRERISQKPRGLVQTRAYTLPAGIQGSTFPSRAISLGYAARALAALDGDVRWHLGTSVRVP
jgi:hypothetical protein